MGWVPEQQERTVLVHAKDLWRVGSALVGKPALVLQTSYRASISYWYLVSARELSTNGVEFEDMDEPLECMVRESTVDALCLPWHRQQIECFLQVQTLR